MVGDSITDISTARAAAIPVVAVDFGYTDVPVSALGPDRVISHFDALFEAVRSLTEPRAPGLEGRDRAISSAVEHSLHTGGATGSIPVSPTMLSARTD